MVSLMQPPPKGTEASTRFCSARFSENRYSASGCSRLFTKASANLRKKPDGSRLGEIAADTALTAVGEVEKDGELWLHIEKGKNNKEGYMLAELVRQVKPVELIPVTEGEVRALFPVVGRDPIAEIKNEIPFTYTEEDRDILAHLHGLALL